MVLAKVTAAESRLERVAIHDAQLFPSDDTPRSFLALLHREGTIGKVEDISCLFKQEWEDLLFDLGIVLVGVSIHEHVLFAAVTMQVTKEEQFALLLHLLYELLQVKYCWMLFGVGVHPDTIQVAP